MKGTIFLICTNFLNHCNKKFILLLDKGLYPNEYMDDWEKCYETSLSEKEDFYSHLNIEDVTEGNFEYIKRVCKDFDFKKFRKLL